MRLRFSRKTLRVLLHSSKEVREDLAAFFQFFKDENYSAPLTKNSQILRGPGSKAIKKICYGAGVYFVQHQDRQGRRRQIHFYKHKLGIIVFHAFLVTTKKAREEEELQSAQLQMKVGLAECAAANSWGELKSLFKVRGTSPASLPSYFRTLRRPLLSEKS